jgi:phosphohistidine phosphatase
LIVGYNPELEELLVNLVGAPSVPDVDKLLPTAALARMIMPDDWTSLDSRCAKWLSITHAKSLLEGGI